MSGASRHRTEDVTPSHPDFDRSGLTDQQFIEQLMFEIKELKSVIRRKDATIESLKAGRTAVEPLSLGKKQELAGSVPVLQRIEVPQPIDIPQRSARRRKMEDEHEDSKALPPPPESAKETEAPVESVQAPVEVGQTLKEAVQTPNDTKEQSLTEVPATKPEADETKAHKKHQSDEVLKAIESKLSQIDVNNDLDDEPVDLSYPRRRGRDKEAFRNVSTSTTVEDAEAETETEPKTETEAKADREVSSSRSSVYSEETRTVPSTPNDKTPQVPTNDASDKIDESMDSMGDSTHHGYDTSTDRNTLRPYTSSDTQNSGHNTTSEIFQHMNHSSSSFQSYRSRIKLPPTLQHQAQAQAAAASTSVQTSPQSHYSPQVNESPKQFASPHLGSATMPAVLSPQQNEPPRIPLPVSPDETKSNVLTSPSKGISHSKTFRDLNIQSLKLDVPPVAKESALRSPAVITGNHEGQQTSVQNHTNQTNLQNHTTHANLQPSNFAPEVQPYQAPHDQSLPRMETPRVGEFDMPSTPEAFSSVQKPFDDTTSARSSPAKPYSQASQASPATGYSYMDSIRTPITNEYDSMYNVKNGSHSTTNVGRDEEEGLFIKPEDFQTIAITVVSTISPGNLGQTTSKKIDDIYVTLAIADRHSGKEMWRIRKSLHQLMAFDNEIRPTIEYFGLPILPDKSLFVSTTPNKIDLRINALQNYFNTLFVMPHIPHLILFRICKYLSLDFINPLDDRIGARKEGYLVRKYKGLGASWRIRWCQVDGTVLELYDVPGGSLLETINLVGCQIGRQSNDSVAEDKGYRHAFLIMETQKSSKLSSSVPKHFFCAETDYERDEWVDVLIEYSQLGSSSSTVNSIHDDSSVASMAINTPRSHVSDVHDDIDTNRSFKSPASVHPGDVSGSTTASNDKKKKRSLFPFRNKATPSQPDVADELNIDLQPGPNGTGNGPDDSIQSYLDKMGLDDNVNKQIFGRNIEQAFEASHHPFLGRNIPSVCFRCLEFLLKTGAIYEEGIFRLSGSASTIRQLKELFNKQFDVDLFAAELKPDIHTVAGLFKTYLRELPSPIIGDKAYHELRQIVMDRGNHSGTSLIFRDYLNNPSNIDKIHYDVSFIIFKFLKEIVNNKDANKMNLRNVCIVFVPTLNISLEVLSLILVDFKCIFEGGEPVDDGDREKLDLNIPSF